MYYIYKGSKKVDSFYLNEFPIKFIHESNKTKKEVHLKVDEIGFFRRIYPSQMFPIRKNSCIFFTTLKEATDYIINSVSSIELDERFSLIEKEILISYLQSLKIDY